MGKELWKVLSKLAGLMTSALVEQEKKSVSLQRVNIETFLTVMLGKKVTGSVLVHVEH